MLQQWIFRIPARYDDGVRDIGDIVNPLGERPIAVITLTASSSAGVNHTIWVLGTKAFTDGEHLTAQQARTLASDLRAASSSC